MEIEERIRLNGLMDVEAVQRALDRSRASVYRYANTDLNELNLPYAPDRLNPEYRSHKDDPLLFHPNEVARFARDVLGIKHVIIEVHEAPPTPTQVVLQEILEELRSIHQLLKERS